HHEVVMLRRRPQKMTRVVVDDRDPWIRIRMIGMMLAAEANDRRIDLHRINMANAMTKRGSDIGSGAGAEYQHVLKRVAEDAIGPLIEVFLLLNRRHRLVKDVVHLDDGVR